jgi:hypothetical protein
MSIGKVLSFSLVPYFYKNVIFPNSVDEFTLECKESSVSFKSIVLTESLESFTVGKVNCALSRLLIVFEVTIVLYPEVVNVIEVGKVKFLAKDLRTVVIKDSVTMKISR